MIKLYWNLFTLELARGHWSLYITLSYQVMLVVSTVEPLALGGEEVAVMVSKEKSENGREEMQPAMDRVEEEVGMERGAIRGHGQEEEEDEMSMESPSKRIRLSSAEDEAGPCDSQDGVSQVCIGKICFLLKCMYLFVEMIKSNNTLPAIETNGAGREWGKQ